MKVSLFCYSFFFLMSGSAMAQIVKTKFSYESLQGFWKSRIEASESAAFTAYQDIFKEDAVDSGEDSAARVTWLDDELSGKVGQFMIRSLPPESAAILMQRELSLHFFLQKESNKSIPTAEVGGLSRSAQSNTLQSQVQKASYELFVINIARYREGTSLLEKCQRIEAAAEYLTAADAIELEVDPLLQRLVNSLVLAQEKVLHEKVACKVRPASTGTRNLQKVTEQLDTAIVDSLQFQYNSSIKPIADVQLTKLDDLLLDIYRIDPYTKEIFDFASLLKGAEASLKLVEGDVFELGGLLNKVQTIDFDVIRSTVGKTFEPDEIVQVAKAQADLVERLRILVTKLEKLPTIVSDNRKTAFSSCSSLVKGLSKLQTATGMDANQTPLFMANFSRCLQAADAYLKNLLLVSEDRQNLDNFARYLQALSDTKLSVTKP